MAVKNNTYLYLSSTRSTISSRLGYIFEESLHLTLLLSTILQHNVRIDIVECIVPIPSSFHVDVGLHSR